jgi:hypothetical protein
MDAGLRRHDEKKRFARRLPFFSVMAGLVPAIHAFGLRKQDGMPEPSCIMRGSPTATPADRGGLAWFGSANSHLTFTLNAYILGFGGWSAAKQSSL